MIKNKSEYIEEINKHKEKYIDIVNRDSFRNKYHLMAPIGWINDPNGLCQFKGEYHFFYQYSPLEAKGGLKFWGHYSSTDLVNWNEKDIAIFPDKEWDRNGVYSGSALVKDDEVYFFYTGNVKIEGDHDYILTGREQNVIMVKTSDCINFSEKKLLLTNADFPEDMSLHVRDPKVWEEDGSYYMVLGARGENDKGYVLLYKSDDLYNWTLKSVPAGGQDDLGYMWECPDVFKLDGKEVFMFSPQGLEADGYKYNNVYQSGYTICEFEDDKSKLNLGDFNELDRGFDFYAPQTTEDKYGRKILIGWMGLPEIDYPTDKNGWAHCLTIPRELKLIDNKLIQQPVKELELLRGKNRKEVYALNNEEKDIVDFNEKTYELICKFNNFNGKYVGIKLRKGIDEETVFYYDIENNKLVLDRSKSGEVFATEYGTERKCEYAGKELKLQVFVDTSSVEIFVNDGEEVFTSRIFTKDTSTGVSVFTDKQTDVEIDLWKIDKN